MKIVKFNRENVTEEEVERKVSKSRGIILNKEGKALIVKYAGLYMFPGGQIENESPEEALAREIVEEAGIKRINFEKEPFLKLESYDRNYFTRKLGKSITRYTETFFYYGTTDENINFDVQKLSQNEKQEEFLISFENLSVIRYLAETNQSTNKKKVNFNRELFTAMNEFRNYKIEKENEFDRKN